MVRRSLAAFVLLVVAVSCQWKQSELVRYFDDGMSKPTVALAPIVEKVPVNVPWSFSNELTEKIYDKLVKSNDFYFPRNNEAILSHLAGREDLFVEDTSFLNSVELGNTDFLVLTELIGHKEVKFTGQKVKPVYPKDGKIGSVIMIQMRVKVLDLRKDEPQIVLQEIVHSNHLIGKDDAFYTYDKATWGTQSYKYTPMNMAHARLANDIVKHLRTYINFAKRSVT